MTPMEWITAGGLVVGFGLTILSIRASRRTAKQLATMNFIRSFWEFQKLLMKRYANGDVDPKEEASHNLDMLMDLERLAVGWRVGIYDWKIIKYCIGPSLIELYEVSEGIIEQRRNIPTPGDTNKDEFKEIERLVEKMRKDPPTYEKKWLSKLLEQFRGF